MILLDTKFAHFMSNQNRGDSTTAQHGKQYHK
jgi:hypothetical protein